MSQGFQVFSAPPNPADFAGTILAQNTNFKQGRIQQFNVNVEQELPGQIVLTAGYAGSRASHILVFGNNINVTSPTACGTVADTRWDADLNGAAFGVPYPAFPFSEIDSIYDAGRAHYNSLQIKAETKSARHGIYALIGYTYSRAYDTGFSDGLGSIIGATYFPLPNWQNLDWGLSQINLNHEFHRQHYLSAAVRQRPEMGRQPQRRRQRDRRRLGTDGDRKSHVRLSGLCRRQQQHVRRGLVEHQRAKPDPPESDLQSRVEQPDAVRVVQSRVLRAAGGGPTRKRQPDAALGSGFRQHGLLHH